MRSGSGTGSSPRNAKRAFAVVAPLTAFVGKAGAAGRASVPAVPTVTTVLGDVKHVYAIAAIPIESAQTSRKTAHHGRYVWKERSTPHAPQDEAAASKLLEPAARLRRNQCVIANPVGAIRGAIAPIAVPAFI